MIFKRAAVATLIAAMFVSSPVLARSLEVELQDLLVKHPLLNSAQRPLPLQVRFVPRQRQQLGHACRDNVRLRHLCCGVREKWSSVGRQS